MPGDPSLSIAIKLAAALGAAADPPWLPDGDRCIAVVQDIQHSVVPSFLVPVATIEELEQRLADAFRLRAMDPASCPGIASDTDRMNVLIRLWAGCVWTGKMIAIGTRSGETSPETRAAFFRDVVIPSSSACDVYKAGALHAAAWKRSLHQDVRLDGVPEPWKAHYERALSST